MGFNQPENRTMIWGWLIGCLCAVVVLNWGISERCFARDVNPQSATEGVPGWPEGVDVGMSVEKLVELRPKAKTMQQMVSGEGEERGEGLVDGTYNETGRYNGKKTHVARSYYVGNGKVRAVAITIREKVRVDDKSGGGDVREWLAKVWDTYGEEQANQCVRTLRGGDFIYNNPAWRWKFGQSFAIVSVTRKFTEVSPLFREWYFICGNKKEDIINHFSDYRPEEHGDDLFQPFDRDTE